jgi:trimethylamine--corrinoid protein Co-methyltransferase
MFVNRMPRFEPLSLDALETLDRGWRSLASEVGVEVLHPRALALLEAAGQRVDGVRVRFDPVFLLEQAALAPSTFTLHARNPERSVVVGGDHMVFVPVQGPPNVIRDGVRRTSTLADFDELCRFAQVVDELDSAGGLPVETNDVPVEVRHLEHVRSLVRLTDKLFQGSQISETAARDSLVIGELVFGDELARGACMYTNVNVNSPLRWDERMLDALLVYAEAGQAVVVVPFLLMGAMAPVSVPAALVQQTVEALVGVALTQLVRPGCPVVMGGFLSNVDMQSGAPAFGGPESALGLLCTGQIARRLGLPWRAGGGALTSSPAPDAQAAYEGLTTMTAAFLAGANLVLHTAGWLESGLATSVEKAVIDLELVRVLREEFTPLEIDESSLALDAHVEVGPGGHFFGAAHTLSRFRECFYRPLVSTTMSGDRWLEEGARDAAARAALVFEEILDGYEQPPLDPAVDEAVEAFVVRRAAELGHATLPWRTAAPVRVRRERPAGRRDRRRRRTT